MVCVAFRNEEQNVTRCVKALLKLNFPKFQIHLADDDSSDGTLAILREYERNNEQITVIEVNQSDQRTKGKARALAQLTDNLTCDFIAFTDADVAVTENWLTNMVASIGQKGLVSGTTLIAQKTRFYQWQAMDWLLGQLQVQIASRFLAKTPTAMGNNMLVNFEAYQQIGGYGKLPFSITEDVRLQQAFENNGYTTQMLFGAGYVVFTQAEKSWGELVNQRKRWANAVKEIPFVMTVLLLFQMLFLPLVLFASLQVNPSYLLFLPIKLMLNTLVLYTKSPVVLGWSISRVLSFEYYQWRLGVQLFYGMLIKETTTWKGRECK